MMHGLGYLILVVFFASSTTTTTARLTLAAVVVTSATTLGCAFIEWSFSSSREVLAQLYYHGELVMWQP